jgi:hypothetical protein
MGFVLPSHDTFVFYPTALPLFLLIETLPTINTAATERKLLRYSETTDVRPLSLE